jgi:3'-phosphoadenosine 5'-phosphosulfate synthase
MLDPATTVMAIWPAPMIYAGPTEVLFHAKSRRNAGATYFVAGRDPAGMKGSELAVAHKNDDLYDGNHGRYVLTMSPGQYPMSIIPFSQVFYDKRDHVMKNKDTSRPDDFIDISGSKMRALAKLGAKPCPPEIPSDLLAAKCIPPGFMVQKGWEIVCDYYQNVESDKWIPYSVMHSDPIVARASKASGVYATASFKLYLQADGKTISPWHDLPLYPVESGSANSLVTMVVEIPMYSTAKMEMCKTETENPIMQDEKDGKPRYYTYGVPFFNYGFLPQTWEDPAFHQGDNDPIDVIEIGETPLVMGAVLHVKVLGALKLIDEGETDHKIIALRSDDRNFHNINSIADLERFRPGTKDKLVDWLLNYKTSDGKPQNTLSSTEPTSVNEALQIISDVNRFYKDLVAPSSSKNTYGFYLPGGASAAGSTYISSPPHVNSNSGSTVLGKKSADVYGVTIV